MTATAGHFLRDADARLRAAEAGTPLPGLGGIAQIAPGLQRLALALTGHLSDMSVGVHRPPSSNDRVSARITPWAQPGQSNTKAASLPATTLAVAAARAGGLLERAAAQLAEASALAGPARHAPGRVSASRNLAAAVTAVTAARDLLHTHFTAPSRLSEWAPVIASQSVARARVSRIAGYIGQAAAIGARAGQAAPGQHEAAHARRLVEQACRLLWQAQLALREAELADPVGAADHHLLEAIPAYRIPAMPPLDGGTGGVGELCDAVTAAAERVRQLTWREAATGLRPALAAEASVASLRQAAGAATVISYTCGALLESVAVQTDWPATPGLGAALGATVQAMREVNGAWMSAGKILGGLVSDSNDVAGSALAASGLALWTGRLAFGDARWTPRRKPGAPSCPAVVERSAIPEVGAAVHQAVYALGRLAHAEAARAAAMCAAGRLFGPAAGEPVTAAYRSASSMVAARAAELLASGLPPSEIAFMAGLGDEDARKLEAGPSPAARQAVLREILAAVYRRRPAVPATRGLGSTPRYSPAGTEELTRLLDAYTTIEDQSRTLMDNMDHAVLEADSWPATLAFARRVTTAGMWRAAGERSRHAVAEAQRRAIQQQLVRFGGDRPPGPRGAVSGEPGVNGQQETPAHQAAGRVAPQETGPELGI